MALRKVSIPTLRNQVGILTLRRAILEWYRFLLCAEHKHSKFLFTAVVSFNHNAVVDDFEFAFQDIANTVAVVSNRLLCLFSFIRTYHVVTTCYHLQLKF